MSSQNREPRQKQKVNQMTLSACRRELTRLKGEGHDQSKRYAQIKERKAILEERKKRQGHHIRCPLCRRVRFEVQGTQTFCACWA
jgi:hypothetical protein